MGAVHAETQFLAVLAHKKHEQEHIRQNDPDCGKHSDIPYALPFASSPRLSLVSPCHCEAGGPGRFLSSPAPSIIVSQNDFGAARFRSEKEGDAARLSGASMQVFRALC